MWGRRDLQKCQSRGKKSTSNPIDIFDRLSYVQLTHSGMLRWEVREEDKDKAYALDNTKIVTLSNTLVGVDTYHDSHSPHLQFSPVATNCPKML